MPQAATRHGVGRAQLRVVGMGAILVGCSVGEYRYTEVEGRGTWRTEAESACMATRPASPTITALSAFTENGTCGMDFPLEVTALSIGTVQIKPTAKLNCPFTTALESWISASVQPAARAHLGSSVVEMKQISAYACRNRNNFGRELSEHAFGNALDVSGFKLANGREIIIQSSWNGAPDEQAFLRQVFAGACRHFTTTLGPGSNIMHYNHVHVDLAKVAPDGSPTMCKPPLGDGMSAGAAADLPSPEAVTATLEPAVPGAD